ncbi:4091_t:CDS:1, partial [Racocetra persica]
EISKQIYNRVSDIGEHEYIESFEDSINYSYRAILGDHLEDIKE